MASALADPASPSCWSITTTWLPLWQILPLPATGASLQHGFRSGRSCLSQLLEHHNKIFDELEKSNNVDVIYLDVTKAFDKVDNGILLRKLKKIGINGKVGVWIHNFLSNRQQCVAVNQTTGEAQVRISLPQFRVSARAPPIPKAVLI